MYDETTTNLHCVEILSNLQEFWLLYWEKKDTVATTKIPFFGYPFLYSPKKNLTLLELGFNCSKLVKYIKNLRVRTCIFQS